MTSIMGKPHLLQNQIHIIQDNCLEYLLTLKANAILDAFNYIEVN